MVEKFVRDEAAYLAWLEAHPKGYVVNIDEPQVTPQYPMVHAATHKSMSSPLRTNYTTGRYFKVCAESLDELEEWSQTMYGRALTRCRQCMLA